MTCDIVSSGNFFLYDVDNVTFPFLITPGADSWTFYVDSDSNTGMGTNSPDVQLNIQGGGNMVTPQPDTVLHLENDGADGYGTDLTITAARDKSSRIHFARPEDPDAGGIYYSHTTDNFTFVAAGVTRIIGEVPLREFTRSQADRFVQTRTREGVKPATINRGLAVLKHLLARAAERGHLDSHPLLRYRMLPEVQEPLRILTYGEYRRLIEIVAHEDLVVGAYIAVLGETGMRKSEGLRLRWDHIRRAERVVLIGRTKSGKVRSVPISDLAVAWLEKLVRFIDIPEVFVNPETRRPWKDPRGPFERARVKAELDWVGFHDLRHFRATQWLMRGLDVNTVKELLGHADIQTTMRYVHYVDSHATRSVREAQRAELQEWQSRHSVTGRKLDDR